MSYENPKAKLDQAIAALREARPDVKTIDAAGERVWQQLSEHVRNGAPSAPVDSIRGCDDVRLLLPQYHAGGLSPARVLLITDHLHECPACRKEAERTRGSAVLLPWQKELPKTRQNHFRWLATIAAVIFVAVAGFYLQDKLAIPAGARATVEAVNGDLYLVNASGESRLQPGARLNEGEKVRTASASHAMLRLRDGSLVEMNQHAEFAVTARRNDTTIALDGGDIIVQAARRSSGHLYVAAQDCTVSVTGTVFAVNSGLKGSRVSVLQGEVRVAHDGATAVLRPGEQFTTSQAVSYTPLREEVAWSRDLDKHLALLAAVAHFENKLQQNVQFPNLRYESKLLPLLPQNTVIYAGIPNLGDAIQQANQLFQQELQESPVLREWWEQQVKKNKNGPDFQQVVEELHELGQYLGNEIVFSAAARGQGDGSAIVIAQVQKPGLKEFIEQLASQNKNHGESLRIFTEPELQKASADYRRGLVVLVRPDFLVVGFDVAGVRDFDNLLNHGGGGFSSTQFAARLNQAYNNGAGLLFGADLQQLAIYRHTQNSRPGQFPLQQSGLSDVRYLIAERKDSPTQTLNRAELSFTGARRGVASWLAAPAPIGGLDFVSPNAGAVGAIITKNPALIFDDLMGLAQAGKPGTDSQAQLAMFEAGLKIKVRDDLLKTLGGEVTVALDGPLLPVPSWKAILQVNDSAHLQQTIQQLVTDANGYLPKDEAIILEQQTVDGRVFTTLHYNDKGKPLDITYTFAEGYMVIAPARALVMDALKIHKDGTSLAHSGDFQKLLPQDQFTNVSALLYQNLAPVVGPVAQQLSPSQLESLKSLAAETRPSLVCAYGEESAVRVASTSRLFGFDLNTLLLSSLLRITQPGAGTLKD